MGRSAGDQGVSGYWEQSLRVRDEIVLEMDGSDACRISATELHCETDHVINVTLCRREHHFEKQGSRGLEELWGRQTRV